MKPQEWIESTKRRWDSGHLYEGAQHLAAALEEIARLQAQLSQAERVVVPEWSANDFALERVEQGSYIDRDLRAIFRNAEAGYKFAASRAHSVPASRVLKDGEVAVSRADLIEMVSNANACAYRPHSCEHSDIHAHSKAKARIADALRAQGNEDAT